MHHITDDLLVKCMLDEASAAEQENVKNWMDDDPGNKRYFDHFKLIWEESRELALVRSPDEEQAWSRLQQRIRQAKEPAKVLSMFGTKWRAVAAVFIAVVATAVVYFIAAPGGNGQIITFASGDHSRIDTLPDGSIITLNSHSSISYTSAFTGDTRNVELQGEAFFSVVPDRQKPFIVTTIQATVRVTGTSFNVNANEGKTRVIVETGSVEVNTPKQKIVLKPGQQVAVGKSDTAVKMQAVTDQLYTYYRSREFVCDDTPLWKLVEVLNEAYNVNIVIETPAARQLKLNTTFKNAELDTIIKVICETFSLTAEQKGNTIILKE